MNGGARHVLYFLFSTFYFFAAGAQANDSTAALGAGGLTLTESADIRMASEDLMISTDLVRVRYSFVNESGRPITTRVAFPLPVADLDALGEGDVGWPTENDKNLIDFKVAVDGKRVKPELEEKAFLKDKEVSDVLRRLKVPFGYRPYEIGKAIGKMPAAARKELIARGLAEQSGDWVRPLWTVKSAFHWMQNFPPLKPVAVEHEYKPVVGGSLISAYGYFENPDTYRNDPYFSRACIDDPTNAAIASRLRKQQRRQGNGAVLLARFVEYVLTTGKNWKGSIGRFRLTIDKGMRDNIVSFCMDGVRKAGATAFRVDKANYEPDHDLLVLIVEAPPS